MGVLAMSLRSRQVVVTDRWKGTPLSSHKGQTVMKIVERAGCELLYLLPCFPDLNPIEEAFSKVKGLLRCAESRTCEALIGAVGNSLEGVSGSITLTEAPGSESGATDPQLIRTLPRLLHR